MKKIEKYFNFCIHLLLSTTLKKLRVITWIHGNEEMFPCACSRRCRSLGWPEEPDLLSPATLHPALQPFSTTQVKKTSAPYALLKNTGP